MEKTQNTENEFDINDYIPQPRDIIPDPELLELTIYLIKNFYKLDIPHKEEMLTSLYNHHHYVMGKFIEHVRDKYNITDLSKIDFLGLTIENLKETILTTNSISEKQKGLKLLKELYFELEKIAEKYAVKTQIEDREHIKIRKKSHLINNLKEMKYKNDQQQLKENPNKPPHELL